MLTVSEVIRWNVPEYLFVQPKGIQTEGHAVNLKLLWDIELAERPNSLKSLDHGLYCAKPFSRTAIAKIFIVNGDTTGFDDSEQLSIPE
jgi:hypothetical protein